jgi:hypothetical protein
VIFSIEIVAGKKIETTLGVRGIISFNGLSLNFTSFNESEYGALTNEYKERVQNLPYSDQRKAAIDLADTDIAELNAAIEEKKIEIDAIQQQLLIPIIGSIGRGRNNV